MATDDQTLGIGTAISRAEHNQDYLPSEGKDSMESIWKVGEAAMGRVELRFGLPF